MKHIQFQKVITSPSDFVIVSCGLGTNSVALLIECVKRGVSVDMILFADTGAEKPHTYAYLNYFSKWLQDNGMPAIKTVQANITLEQDCLNRKALPSLAYGFKTCSQRFKIQPQDKYINNQFMVAGRLVKMIGFDADEPHRANGNYEDKFQRVYPLIEWNMGRAECIQSILDAGLALPGKSACYFCPNSQISEIKWLEHNHPDLLQRALEMEAQAELTDIKGLGRNFAWSSVYRQQDAFMSDFHNIEISCDCYEGGAV